VPRSRLSSESLTPIDVKIRLIFAGAQKKLGPAVHRRIIRKDLAERADKKLTLLQYRSTLKKNRSYTHNFAIYIIGLVMEWIDSLGEHCRAKAQRSQGQTLTTRSNKRRLLQVPVERIRVQIERGLRIGAARSRGKRIRQQGKLPISSHRATVPSRQAHLVYKAVELAASKRSQAS